MKKTWVPKIQKGLADYIAIADIMRPWYIKPVSTHDYATWKESILNTRYTVLILNPFQLFSNNFS